MNRITPVLLLLLASACRSDAPRSGDDRALRRAETAFLMRDFNKAFYLYKSCLEADPGTRLRPRLLLRQAKCRMGEENWNEALRLLGEAMRAGPDDEVRIEILYRRAIVYNALWRPRTALADFGAVAQASEDLRGGVLREDEFRYRFGCTLVRAGKWPEGKAQLSLVPPGSHLAEDAGIRLSLDRFAVQIVRCSDADSALRVVEEAGGRGVKARIAEGSPVVVLVGSFDRFDEARREAERLRNRGFAGAFAVP